MRKCTVTASATRISLNESETDAVVEVAGIYGTDDRCKWDGTVTAEMEPGCPGYPEAFHPIDETSAIGGVDLRLCAPGSTFQISLTLGCKCGGEPALLALRHAGKIFPSRENDDASRSMTYKQRA